MTDVSFKDLGLCDELVEACASMQWKSPTPVQLEAIPVALDGKDVVGLAETGSGKTAAFGLPILHNLLDVTRPQDRPYYALVLSPTRELAIQIKEQLDDLGKGFGLQCCAVVGGMEFTQQAKMILSKPHIIIATLGRLAHLVKELKGFTAILNKMRYLVMDEADRILSMDFENELDSVLRCLPYDRRTMLFSATITNKIGELQRAHLKDAVKVQINSSFKIADSLQQYMIPVAAIEKNMYLLYLVRHLLDKSMIVFCNTRINTLKATTFLRQCGHKATPIYGEMSQPKRLEALEKFKSQERSVLIATDVASRGLDIPCVDYVINMEVPNKSEDYIHRVGRTARAGRPGVAVTIVSQYEIEVFYCLEELIVKHTDRGRMETYPVNDTEVEQLQPIVREAEEKAEKEHKFLEMERKRKRRGNTSDDEEETSNARKKFPAKSGHLKKNKKFNKKKK